MQKAYSHEEHEHKIQSQANLQFKYTSIATPDVFRKQVIMLFNLIPVKLGKMSQKYFCDDYFDFENLLLKQKGFSFRTRRGENNPGFCKITLKHDTEDNHERDKNHEGMRRKEKELELPYQGENSWEQLKQNPSEIFKLLDVEDIFYGKNEFKYLGSVRNERSNFEITTDLARWQFSYWHAPDH
jgi:hypothetical protein